MFVNVINVFIQEPARFGQVQYYVESDLEGHSRLNKSVATKKAFYKEGVSRWDSFEPQTAEIHRLWKGLHKLCIAKLRLLKSRSRCSVPLCQYHNQRAVLGWDERQVGTFCLNWFVRTCTITYPNPAKHAKARLCFFNLQHIRWVRSILLIYPLTFQKENAINFLIDFHRIYAARQNKQALFLNFCWQKNLLRPTSVRVLQLLWQQKWTQ